MQRADLRSADALPLQAGLFNQRTGEIALWPLERAAGAWTRERLLFAPFCCILRHAYFRSAIVRRKGKLGREYDALRCAICAVPVGKLALLRFYLNYRA